MKEKNITKLFTHIFCLAIWVFELIFGIVKIINNEAIPPVVFICAVVVCIVYHLAEILHEN